MPNNVAKTCFLGFLRQYLRKTLRRLAVLLRLSSNLQDRRLLYCKSCTKNKIDHFRSKRNRFWAKQRRKKTCFLGFLRHYLKKTLRKFAIKIRLSLNLQGSRLFDCKRWANNKNGHFFESKLSFWPKNLEKSCFQGFAILLQEIVSQICCIAPIELKLTGWTPI